MTKTSKLRDSFNYPEETNLPDAYEQVIVDAIHSKKSLFAEGGEVVRSWEIVAPLQEAWLRGESPLRFYDKGDSAKSLFA